jgi:hypothetical protein
VQAHLVPLIAVVQVVAEAAAEVLVPQLVQMEVLVEMEIHLEPEEQVIQEEQAQVEMQVVMVQEVCYY